MFFSEDGNGQRILAPSSAQRLFRPGEAEQAFAEQRLATEADWPASADWLIFCPKSTHFVIP